ncbi:aminoethylphosphonate catabolism associated LysR family transcriptional regulator [Roseovarius nanhaiticus]|uniref:Aminoethylphosphonate catabolism associated LysR family transcriptional regulator n=1 Tax=Roseovarius nanhaiticus TaxID=573024 RepID=A0A1N7HKE8_9RHOB|nr:LysR substrate-binding domain-containing protein [Roseovarius nanhaiticus]SEL25547.1 aminoethylphosphonate catabolism associated LysR family transcriptional regulator [Roseovarius nanhaiticus]SIS25339.1 aminoethylphosphonate catabolism associated LysR family transcriptional regulator [Roseovarius nanhaiticus]
MRHSQLRAFHYVAAHGGFSRAAEALFLTQPAVSEQVRKLEQEHDVLLFHRERKRVRLTETGEHLFLLTRQLFEVEQRIADYMSETRAAIEGELRIVADSAHHVIDLLSQFRQRYPGVTVSLRSGNTEEILAELRGYNADIGVIGDAPTGPDLELLDLGQTPIIAFAARGLLQAPEAGLTLTEALTYPLVLREHGSKTRASIEEEVARQKLTMAPGIVAEGREAVREIVASGAGIGFVSLAEFGHDTRLVQIPLNGVDIRMRETIVHLGQRRDVRVIRTFMEFARPSGGAA